MLKLTDVFGNDIYIEPEEVKMATKAYKEMRDAEQGTVRPLPGEGQPMTAIKGCNIFTFSGAISVLEEPREVMELKQKHFN